MASLHRGQSRNPAKWLGLLVIAALFAVLLAMDVVSRVTREDAGDSGQSPPASTATLPAGGP